MKPAMIYRWSNKLKLEFVSEPELIYILTVDNTSLRMPPGKLYDLVRILNSYIARHQVALSKLNNEPVHHTGDRTQKNRYYQDKEKAENQFELFPEPEAESEKDKRIRELKEELAELEKEETNV